MIVMEIILMRGLPGSGKSTFAGRFMERNPGYVRISRDDLRKMLHAGSWSAEAEFVTVRVRDVLVFQALLSGMNVIIDETSLRSYQVGSLRSIARLAGAGIRAFEMDTPLEECISRDSRREKPVGELKIREMHDSMEPLPDGFPVLVVSGDAVSE